MVTGHRLMMRGTHHDTHTIGQLAVLRVVGIESPAPHGRPHHITLQTENKLKDLLVECPAAIFSTEGILHPCGQTGSLIVQEDTTKLHSGFTGSIGTILHPSLRMLCHRSISPPVPGRHTQLTTQLVDAIDGATLVAAGNDDGG